ncbi:MAG: tRNA (cytidine(34)-2'-O)-methyltransferase [Phycisphaerales bacterium]
MPEPILHVALLEPEIPNNTGVIGRTCVAVGAALHLIHPLGFDIDAKARRRAGLDYWERLDVREHADLEAYLAAANAASPAPTIWALSARSSRPIWEATIRPGDHLLLGKETVGLAPDVLERFRETAVCLPMSPGERSLNVATVMTSAVYEGVRQMIGRGEASLDPAGRLIRAEHA